ncbi:FtsW/RodA/SpoVE family cell cycle protein [Cyclobacterium sp. 1_MG-2023]|uniref:FtsW/RodA/SpoVE family cell cycle protein n=1 Tax=Cyclobacterium sp. 1_MG-2023 TaxID=3062681 RepID=UPI0026E1185F|nr:FtsW/RodA/SpoVE family cell cycle protein [Cyclobacterium sp. 1_MG-2023]MDO6438221.1 FtsW/RodA/SpoVE family cell cycle protein [Cyclobacterium sp. 1_MG-2023]
MTKVKIWLEDNLKGDPVIWGIVLLLSLISILAVYSATGSLAYRKMGGNTEVYLFKHSALIFASIVVMWAVHNIPYKYFSKLSLFALWVSVPLLMITYLFGSTINEANRWLTVPIINQAFQPSDLAKLALISAVAGMLAKRQRKITDIKGTFIPIIIWIGIICLLIAIANMSTAVMLLSTCLLLMFIGRVPLKYLLVVCMVGALVLTTAILMGQRGGVFFSRIERFMNDDPAEIPFQAKHSYIAIATGGISGKGPGNSEQRNILPHPYSDFIYAIIVEEYGMIGGGFVLFLYLALLYRGMRVVAISTRPFGGLLSAGLSFSLVIQAMINMGVAVGLVPITGLPLPMVSMGGTSLIFTGISLGIILSISRGDHEDAFINEQKSVSRKVKVA